MEADDASAVGGQGFRVTERLRALQNREGITRLWNLRAGVIVSRDDKGSDVVAFAFVQPLPSDLRWGCFQSFTSCAAQ